MSFWSMNESGSNASKTFYGRSEHVLNVDEQTNS